MAEKAAVAKAGVGFQPGWRVGMWIFLIWLPWQWRLTISLHFSAMAARVRSLRRISSHSGEKAASGAGHRWHRSRIEDIGLSRRSNETWREVACQPAVLDY